MTPALALHPLFAGISSEALASLERCLQTRRFDAGDIILRVVVEGRDLTDLRVRDAMSSTLFTCRADDPVEAVAKRMEDHQVRRLPVVGDDGTVVGIVVRSDLVRAIADGPEPASPPPPGAERIAAPA